MFTLRWSDSSRRWIDNLETFPERLADRCVKPALHFGALFAVRQARTIIRSAGMVFQGDMLGDIQSSSVREVGDLKLRVVVGESGQLQLGTAYGDVGGWEHDPFSYIWGKHSGIEKHKVWLYTSRPNSRGRKKLREWLRTHGVPQLPESEEEFDRMKNEGTINMPPWIEVAPESRDFLHHMVVDGSLASNIMRNFRRRLSEVW